MGIDAAMDCFSHIDGLRLELETMAAKFNEELSGAAEEEEFQATIRRRVFDPYSINSRYRQNYFYEVRVRLSDIAGFPREGLYELAKKYAVGIEAYPVGNLVKTIPANAPILSKKMLKAIDGLDMHAVKELVKNGDTVYARMENGDGPLHYLLKNYTSLTNVTFRDPDFHKKYAIQEAEAMRFFNKLVNEYRLDPHDLNVKNNESILFFHFKSSFLTDLFLNVMKEYKIDLNILNKNGDSLLHSMVGRSSYTHFSLLIKDYGCNVNLKNPKNFCHYYFFTKFAFKRIYANTIGN